MLRKPASARCFGCAEGRSIAKSNGAVKQTCSVTVVMLTCTAVVVTMPRAAALYAACTRPSDTPYIGRCTHETAALFCCTLHVPGDASGGLPLLLERLAFGWVRQRLGGRVRYMTTGGGQGTGTAC